MAVTGFGRHDWQLEIATGMVGIVDGYTQVLHIYIVSIHSNRTSSTTFTTRTHDRAPVLWTVLWTRENKKTGDISDSWPILNPAEKRASQSIIHIHTWTFLDRPSTSTSTSPSPPLANRNPPPSRTNNTIRWEANKFCA